MHLLNHLVLCLREVKLLTFFNHTHECCENGGVLGVATLLVFADLVQQVCLAVYLLCEVVFKILVFCFFI